MDIPSFTEKGIPNCAVVDPEIFFPEQDEPDYEEKVNAAKAVCSDCPYLEECLKYAVVNNELGIWGKTTRDERLKIKRRAIRARSRERANSYN